jgi:DUF2075 family protein
MSVARGMVAESNGLTDQGLAMFLLRGSVAVLGKQAAANQMVPHMTERFRMESGRSPSRSEVLSWERSLPLLLGRLADAGLDEVEVLLEYKLPRYSGRADVVLLGEHPKGGPSCVVVENKQWSGAGLVDVENGLVTVPGVPGQERSFPQEQVRGYVQHLRNFNRYLGEHPRSVAGCVYMHNAMSGSITGLRHPDLAGLADFPIFAGDELAAFRAFLTARLAPASGAQVADDFLQSKNAPSKQLLQHAREAIAGNPQFTLLDEQQVAFNVVLRAVQHAKRADSKEAVIITGGPGSGKSVIAVALLGELAKRGFNVAHATGSRSFTRTLKKVVSRRFPGVADLFVFTNQFTVAERNGMDVLIVDEAHRVREVTSWPRMPKAKRSGIGQADELVRAARVPVFLIDEHQGVRPNEIGTVARIEEACAANGAVVQVIDLNGQFRCGGSEAYVRWVESLLGLRPGGPQPWPGDDAFSVQLADSPLSMETALRRENEQGSVARITAGFCWRWSKPRPDGSLVDDVVIGSWRRPWNLKADKTVNGVPPAVLWATERAGFGQVGCVYTAQGFEYEYGGVIMGADLVWREDHWVADPSASKDPDIRKGTDFDRLARNVYKVLLTRGLQGSAIYSVDSETQQMLAGLGLPVLSEPSGA